DPASSGGAAVATARGARAALARPSAPTPRACRALRPPLPLAVRGARPPRTGHRIGKRPASAAYHLEGRVARGLSSAHDGGEHSRGAAAAPHDLGLDRPALRVLLGPLHLTRAGGDGPILARVVGGGRVAHAHHGGEPDVLLQPGDAGPPLARLHQPHGDRRAYGELSRRSDDDGPLSSPRRAREPARTVLHPRLSRIAREPRRSAPPPAPPPSHP